MNYVESQAYCDYCKCRVVTKRRAPNHTLHAILSLFLCGFWLPVWGAITLLLANGPWRCKTCGTDT